MAAMLVTLAIMSIALSVAMPTWRNMVQREKEEELIFRGQQYARAIGLFQRKYAAAYPPDIETLLKGKFLRKKYRDPMVEDGEFLVLYQASQAQVQAGQGGRGQQQRQGGRTAAGTQQATSGPGSMVFTSQTVGPRGGVIGVASKSTDESIRIYNGRTHYNEWQFIYSAALFGPGQGRPGMRPGQRGPTGVPMGPGGPGGPGRRGPGQGGPGQGGNPPFPPRNPR
jgi:type II secretory pathway pseudopilin PulG